MGIKLAFYTDNYIPDLNGRGCLSYKDNPQLVLRFYSGVRFVFHNEDKNGNYQKCVCFFMVDDMGYHMIFPKDEDRDGGLICQCFSG